MSNEESLQKVAQVQIASERILMQQIDDFTKIWKLAIALGSAVVIGTIFVITTQYRLADIDKSISDIERERQSDRVILENNSQSIRNVESKTRRLEWEVDLIKERIQ